MRPFPSLFAAGFAVLLLTACQPEPKQPAAGVPPLDFSVPKLESNVWKISKAGQPDSYLLGTIHIGKKDSTLSKDAEKLLASVGQLSTEVDMLPEENPQTMQQYRQFYELTAATESLKAKIGDKDFEILQTSFRKNPETAPLADAADRMKPWAAFLFSQSVYPAGYSANSGIDMLLSKAAQKAGKPRRALETMPEMAKSFSDLPEETVVRFLQSTIDDEDTFRQHRELSALYESGRFEDLAGAQKKHTQEVLQKHPEVAPLAQEWFEKDLIVGRNLKWLPEIKAQSAEKSTLFAVGALHLPSKQGLIELLRQDGYEVTPMPKVLMW